MNENLVSGISREKNWDELDDSQKIERMRSQVKLMRNMLEDVIKNTENLLQHSHGLNGNLLVPILDRNVFDRPNYYSENKYF